MKKDETGIMGLNINPRKLRCGIIREMTFEKEERLRKEEEEKAELRMLSFSLMDKQK